MDYRVQIKDSDYYEPYSTECMCNKCSYCIEFSEEL